MKNKFSSLQYKINIIVLLIAVIPIILVGTISYRQSVKIVNNQITQANLNTVQQTADNINSMFVALDSMVMEMWRDEAFMECLRPSSPTSRELVYDLLAAQQRVNHYIVFNTDVYSVYVKAYNGLEFDTMSAKNTIEPELEQQLVKQQGKCTIIQDQILDFDGSPQNVFSLLRVLKDPSDLSRDFAIIKVNVLEKDVSGIYQSNLLCEGSETVIVDQDEKIVSAVKKEDIGSFLGKKGFKIEDTDKAGNYFTKEINGVKCLLTAVNLKATGWKLVNYVPLKELTRDSRIIQQVTVLTIVISIFFCFLCTSIFTKSVLKPLRELARSMSNLEKENFNIVLPEEGQDEVALVCRSFNKMTKKLNELINEVYAVQIKQKEAQLQVLYEQINPHFLYNTLNTIYWMCKIEKACESAKLVDSLSKLFRLSLNSGSEFTTVEKEIEYLNYYIAIQKKRYEETIAFELDIEKGTQECRTIKLVFQPLVENAIYHGIEKKGSNGTIHISVWREEKSLYFQVQDDGAGADERSVARLLTQPGEDNRGFAIRNVHDRVRLHYGEPYGLKFRSKIGSGTVVTVTQPLEEENL